MLVAMNFKEEEIKNSAFVFCNKTNAQIKIYYEDEYGVWLLQNRLDDKKFKYPILNNSRTITKKEFELICKGLEIIESEGYKDTKNKDYF